MPLQKHLRELWDGICDYGATARPGSLGIIQTLLGVCTFLSWCHFCLSELACLLLPALLFPHPQDIPICISFPSPSPCLVSAGALIGLLWASVCSQARCDYRTGAARLSELRSGLPAPCHWSICCSHVSGEKSWAFSVDAFCWNDNWQPKQKQSSQGRVGLSDPFGGFQSKGSQAQKSTSQLWPPHYWAWSNSTKSGQRWSNLPPTH